MLNCMQASCAKRAGSATMLSLGASFPFVKLRQARLEPGKVTQLKLVKVKQGETSISPLSNIYIINISPVGIKKCLKHCNVNHVNNVNIVLVRGQDTPGTLTLLTLSNHQRFKHFFLETKN